MRITFQWVGVKGVKRWKDADGKSHQETRQFRQTFNPFNKNADGSIKEPSQILAEEKANRDAWLAESEGIDGMTSDRAISTDACDQRSGCANSAIARGR